MEATQPCQSDAERLCFPGWYVPYKGFTLWWIVKNRQKYTIKGSNLSMTGPTHLPLNCLCNTPEWNYSPKSLPLFLLLPVYTTLASRPPPKDMHALCCHSDGP